MPRPPSRLLSLYLGAAAGFFVIKGAVLLTNALTFPRLRPRETPATTLRPRVSLLVPARDEARNLPRTLPGLLAQGADEVIVLDDQSSDGTAELARALGARVIGGQPLPDGWYGKPWACQQLGEAALGDVLIFTDADVTWKPGALGAILHELDDKQADLLSVLPQPEHLTPRRTFSDAAGGRGGAVLPAVPDDGLAAAEPQHRQRPADGLSPRRLRAGRRLQRRAGADSGRHPAGPPPQEAGRAADPGAGRGSGGRHHVRELPGLGGRASARTRWRFICTRARC